MTLNEINIAELLKDCPKGMELDSPMFDNIEFDSINEEGLFPIICRIKNMDGGYDKQVFTSQGCAFPAKYAKCVIFPKGKNTWEGFKPPCKFKDGDILFVDGSNNGEDESFQYIFILDTSNKYGKWQSYCYLRKDGFFKPEKVWLINNAYQPRFATKEEKESLFQAIKDDGYKWNAEKKTLEMLIVPKFKVGDRIKWTGHDASGRIEKIEDNVYHVDYGYDDGCIRVNLNMQDDYELVPDKFDITTLKPFDKVLVRDKNTDEWRGHFFSHYDSNSDRPYVCIGVEGINEYKQCIPYEANEHLLGTTDDCDEYYKTWE